MIAQIAMAIRVSYDVVNFSQKATYARGVVQIVIHVRKQNHTSTAWCGCHMLSKDLLR